MSDAEEIIQGAPADEAPSMIKIPKKAMVLAAGFGSRLRPLTHFVPKPLVPVASLPLIRYALRLLAQFGVEEVMINLHHLPDQVENFLGRQSEGMRLHYSRETEILGTGGGLRKVASFLDETFILINADAIIDLDIAAAVQTHHRQQAIATMVLKKKLKTDPYTTVGVDAQGLVKQIGSKPDYQGEPLKPHFFTGAHIIEPEFIDYIPPDIESCIAGHAYPKVIDDQRPVAAHIHEGLWVDVGTLERYWQINADFLQGRVVTKNFSPLAQVLSEQQERGSEILHIGKKCHIGSTVRLEPPVIICDGARIGEGAVVGPEVVVGENAVIGKNAHIAHSVLLPRAKVDGGDRIDGEAVSRKFRVNMHEVTAE